MVGGLLDGGRVAEREKSGKETGEKGVHGRCPYADFANFVLGPESANPQQFAMRLRGYKVAQRRSSLL
jgi:hypothetical protein